MNKFMKYKDLLSGGLLGTFLLFSCSETDSESYCPTWSGFTYTTGCFSNYVQGKPDHVVTLFSGDSLHLTAHQDKRGHLINSTDYVWILCYDTLDTRNNDDPEDDIVNHVQKEYRLHTNYDGYANGSDDPVGHILIPANALKTTKPDTIKFTAYYTYSGQGVTVESGTIADESSYSGRITPKSGSTGGGAYGYFYFNIIGHQYVDLGLPSGTLWATCNIGAKGPEEYGNYYAWGETSTRGKKKFDWSTYKYCDGSEITITKYCTNSGNGIVDNKTVLINADDAANANWDAEWQMPSKGQLDELLNEDNTTIKTAKTKSGVEGCLITSKKNGNSIFLPAAGYRDGTAFNGVHECGYYWSRMLYQANNNGDNVVNIEGTPITCAEAVQLTNTLLDGEISTETYSVTGYITEKIDITEQIDDAVRTKRQSIWISDTKNGGHVFEAFYANVPNWLVVGMKITVTGQLMKSTIKDATVAILEDSSSACGLCVWGNSTYTGYYDRFRGYSVRPVRVGN